MVLLLYNLRIVTFFKLSCKFCLHVDILRNVGNK